MGISRCTAAEAATLTALAAETFYDTYSHLNTPETMRAYMDTTFTTRRIREELEDPCRSFFMIKEHCTPIAFMQINRAPSQSDINDPQSLEIQRIYIQKEHKRRGLGSMLIRHAVFIAEREQLGRIWLSVWEKNPSAVRFYERMGFHKAGNRIFRMGDELQKDHIMRYEL